MKYYLLRIYRLMVMIGIDPLKFVNFARGIPFYMHDRKILIKQQKLSNIQFPLGTPYPILNERFAGSGTASGHYFHQDLLVALAPVPELLERTALAQHQEKG